MNKIQTTGLVLGLLLAGIIAPALAQVAAPPPPDAVAPAASTAPTAVAAPAAVAPAVPKKMKPHKPKPQPLKLSMIAVTVTNMRAVTLTTLQATPAGGGDAQSLATNLAAGKKATSKIKHNKACLFDLHGAFVDDSTTDLGGIDLCKDSKLNLTEAP